MLDVAGFGIRDDGYTFYRMWYSIVHQFGLEILDEARTGLNPDPRLVEAFDTLVDSEKSWRLDRRKIGADFIGGNVAFFVEGTWVIGDYNRYGLNYTAAPFPSSASGPRRRRIRICLCCLTRPIRMRNASKPARRSSNG